MICKTERWTLERGWEVCKVEHEPGAHVFVSGHPPMHRINDVTKTLEALRQ
jgi:hypothetical protein